MQSRAEMYYQAADWARLEHERAVIPQEKDLLLEIERSFQRLAKMNEWQSDNGEKKRNERHFAVFDFFRGRDG